MAQPAQGSGIRFGQVFGIPIYLHPSWFIIFVLVTAFRSERSSLRSILAGHPRNLGAWNHHERAFLRFGNLPRT